MSTDLKTSREVCRETARTQARNFYFAFRLLPEAERAAMFALYAFCRLADDIADETGTTADKVAGLQKLSDDLKACYEGNGPTDGFWPALKETVETYNIPRDELQTVIDGCEMDIDTTRYQTFEDLGVYLDRVASVIGSMTIRVMGEDPERLKDFIECGGRAVQLTNIIRDVAEDAERGRIYLPKDDMDKYLVGESDILNKNFTPSVKSLISFEVERARHLYKKAQEALQPGDREKLAPLEVIQRIYRRLLNKVESKKFNVLNKRARISGFTKATIALNFLIRKKLGLSV